MAYYLTVEEKRGQFRELPIKNSILFPQHHKYKKDNACSLEELDLLTVNFSDESEFRIFLLKNDILPTRLSNKPLSIRLFNKGKYIKVMYDFLYQKDILYLCEPRKLLEEINYRNKNNDFLFLAKLANAFQNYYECNQTASDLKNWANVSLDIQIRLKYLDKLDQQGDNLVVRFLKLLIYKYYQNNDGSIKYTKEINYLNFHKIIAFMDYYDKENIKNSLCKLEPTYKKKVLKKENEEYLQYSLFD